MPSGKLQSLVTENIGDVFEPIFNPSSIAVIGASTDPESPGYRFVRAHVEFGFDPVYPVNPSTDSVYGLTAYDSVTDIPGPVEFAIVTLRADIVPDIIEECGEKGVDAVHVMSSGFSETGTDEGERLEEKLGHVAAKHDIRLIGPNCVGIYNPASNQSYIAEVSQETGPVSFVSHSGGFTIDVESQGDAHDIGFSKVASIGNSVDIGITDVFEYFAVDDQTEIIGIYLEGVENRDEGYRLFELADAVVEEKPVVALKGGKTDEGGEAAQSHTGSLAGDYRVWRSMFSQAGITTVDTLREMIDVLTLFSRTLSVESNRTALIGPGGGTTVTAIDEVTEAGLEVPGFTDETIEELEDMELPPAGNLTNPVDAPLGVLSTDGGQVLQDITDVAVSDPNVDSVIVHFNINHFWYHPDGETLFENMVESIRQTHQEIDIPLLLVFRNSRHPDMAGPTTEMRQRCSREGIPIYDSIGDAANALRHLVDYNQQ